MKKLIKKMSAFILTAAMVAGMCMTSFATSTNAGSMKDVTAGATANVTVGVSKAADGSDGYANGGDELLMYKVVDITYNDNTNEVVYTFTQLFQDFLTAKGLTMDPKAYGEQSEADLKILLGSFTSYMKGLTPIPDPYKRGTTSTEGVATFENVDMGQYIVIGNGASKGAKIYQTVTAEVKPESVDDTVNGGKKYIMYTDYTVAMKTSTPDIGKSITGGTVEDKDIPYTKPTDGSDKHDNHFQTSEVGKTVNYELTVNVPTYPDGATNQTFYVGDKLSKGLDLLMDDKNKIVVTGYADGVAKVLTVDTDYYLNTKINYAEGKPEESANKESTDLYVDFIFGQIAGFDKVTITYNAKLNANAEVGTIAGNPNNADLVYSNDPFNGETWKPNPENPEEGRPGHENGYGEDKDMEILYTYAFVIDKFEEKMENEKLAGAEFELYRKYDEATKTYSEPVFEINADGTVSENVVTLKTDIGGAAAFKGIEKGTYYLKETVAPTGYNLMEDAVVIVIDANSIPYSTQTTESSTHYTYTATDNGKGQAKLNGDLVWINEAGNVATGTEAPDETYGPAYEKSATVTEGTTVIEINKDVEGANGFYRAGVSNNTGAQLPSTGGMGTTIFTVVGLVLMIGAAIVLIARRRMTGRE